MTRTLNNVVTYYVYDGEKPILEYKAGGANNGWNVYGKGVDEILQRGYLSGSTWVWYFYQQDHEGNVTHLTDTTGAVLERYKFDAFGKPVIYNAAGTIIYDAAAGIFTGSAYNNRFLFTGREWAPANLGFYEYRARAYHPGSGRFMSEDPVGMQIEGAKPSIDAALVYWPDKAPDKFNSTEFNLFRYCANDPEDKTDPTGLYFSVPPELAKDFAAARKYLEQDPGMAKLFKSIDNDKAHQVKVVAIQNGADYFGHNKNGDGGGAIFWNPRGGNRTNNGGQSPALQLGHEVSHAERYLGDSKGYLDDIARTEGHAGPLTFKNKEEQRVITGPERSAALSLHEAVRSDGFGQMVEVGTVLSLPP